MLKPLLAKMSHLIPDAPYLKLRYWLKFHKKLELKHPRSFNEKSQWLKLHDRRPEYTMMADKYEVKKYVADKIGEEHIIPTLGVWNSFDEIDFDALPNQFVLKCTHDSGGIVICTDKATFDKDGARKKIQAHLKNNYFWHTREWPYKNIKPRIIAEQYMVDESGVELKDYKIFCFDGSTKLIQVDFDRFTGHKRNVYTPDWELVDLKMEYPKGDDKIIPRPKELDKMLHFASILSKGIPQVRVDFYYINDNIYFGEITFFHGSGYKRFTPAEWDEIMGSWITLPEKTR